MSEPRIIVTTLADATALGLGSSEHSISAEDLAFLPPLILSEDGIVSLDLEETGWNVVDLDAPETPVLPGGNCARCVAGGGGFRVAKDEVIWAVKMTDRCHDCMARNYTWPMIDKPCRWVLDGIVRPSPKVPTPLDAQQVLWNEIQDGSLVGHTILYSGPHKFGKTTMAAKLMEMTFLNYFNRGYADDFPNHRLPIWQVNVPDWIDAMRAYRNRDFNSHEIVRPPEPTSRDVRDWFHEFQEGQRERCEEVSDGEKYPPILFLDELDKFSATEHTTRWLFNLLNAVMASGGAIISTTNMTPVQLEKHLGEPLYRRVVESALDGKDRVRILSYPPKSKR